MKKLVKKVLSESQYTCLRKLVRGLFLIGFRRPIFKLIKVGKIRFWLLIDPKNGELDEFIYIGRSSYEPQVTKKILENLRDDSTFLDIGANIGYYTNLCGTVLKKGRVLSFEPIKRLYEQNRKSIGKNNLKNVKIFNFGCGTKYETKSIYINDENVAGASLIKKKYRLEKKGGSEYLEKVNLVRLDNFLKNEEKIDFVKIDVEGFEYCVLKGMKKILKKFRPKIIIEFSSYTYEKQKKGLSEEILNFLFSFYKFIEIIEIGGIFSKKKFLKNKILKKQLNLFCYN